MTIDELNALTTLTAADEVPVWDKEESGEPTKKITAQNMAASVKSLASLPNTTEMNTAIQQSTANVYTKTETDDAIAQSLGGVKFATLVNTGSSNRIRIRNALAASSYFVMSMDRRNGGATICAAVQFYDSAASCSVMTNGFSGTFSAAIDAYGIIVTLPNTNQSITVIGNAAFTLETV